VAETTTANYGWTMPDPGASANTWGATLNATTQKVDAQVFANQGLLANYLPLTGGAIAGNVTVSGTFSVSGSATFANVTTASITASGNVATATLTATGNIVSSGTIQGAYVSSTGDISGNNISGNNGVSAGPGGFATNASLYAGGGVNAGSATIQTGGNVSSNSVTTNQITTGGATYFFHNTYGDFGTNINTGNNSRWLQFATGWSIQAIVNSSAYFFYIGGNVVETLDYQGNLVIYGQGYKPGGGAWAASSDERVKRDIKPYQQGLKELSRLEPVSFAYNGQGGTQNDGKRYVGLVAQAARQAMPSLVHEMPEKFNGKISGQLATDASELIFTLINAVKELSARVAQLEAR
jgi:hypothetical protein